MKTETLDHYLSINGSGPCIHVYVLNAESQYDSTASFSANGAVHLVHDVVFANISDMPTA